ncbi:MAG: hypothetical protein ACRDT9_17560, partial [Agromyces sp.]
VVELDGCRGRSRESSSEIRFPQLVPHPPIVTLIGLDATDPGRPARDVALCGQTLDATDPGRPARRSRTAQAAQIVRNP